jgi:hypothetical protein
MKTALLATAALFVLSLGCAKREPAGTAPCRTACERVAELRVAPAKAKRAANVHELDEGVDAMEAQSGREIASLKAQLAGGGPPWNPKAFEKQSAAERRELAQRHEWEVRQLKLQRELSIQNAEKALVDAKTRYEEAKQKAEQEDRKATADAATSCYDSCLKRPAAFAQCLQRIQAVEDIDLCEHR